MSEWQPIETAPKDGTRVLVFGFGDDFEVVRWTPDAGLIAPGLPFNRTGAWKTSQDGWLLPNEVTHWMPLPPPPQPAPVTG